MTTIVTLYGQTRPVKFINTQLAKLAVNTYDMSKVRWPRKSPRDSRWTADERSRSLLSPRRPLGGSRVAPLRRDSGGNLASS